MKRIQTARTASQGAGEPRKKRMALVVLVSCVLLLAGTAISAAVLGESLSRFSREESHVIALVPQEEQRSEDIERKENPEEPSLTQPPEAASETTAPRRKTSFRHAAAENSNTAAQTGEYHGQLRVYEAVRSWSTETQVDLFKESYHESGDETVTAEDGKKLIAPGTSNLYEFMLENNGSLPLDYTISLKVENDHGGSESEADVPLEWRLLAGDGSAVSDWRGYSAAAEVMQKATLDARRLDKYSIQWRWDFERGGERDRADTALGDLAAIQPLGAKATIIVHAEGNIEQSTGQGLSIGPKTGDASNLGLYILLMTVSGGGLLILSRDKRIREKR